MVYGSSRVSHFMMGASHSPSLQASADKFNQQVPGKFRANGLNQPYMLSSGNGNSRADASRQTPSGQLPSLNGMSESTYNAINPASYGMRLDI